MRHAFVAPAPAQELALRRGLSVCPVRALIAAANRDGPDALETPGKGQRQRAYLAVAEAHTFLGLRSPHWPLSATEDGGQSPRRPYLSETWTFWPRR
jgi:hypothetical protein